MDREPLPLFPVMKSCRASSFVSCEEVVSTLMLHSKSHFSMIAFNLINKARPVKKKRKKKKEKKRSFSIFGQRNPAPFETTVTCAALSVGQWCSGAFRDSLQTLKFGKYCLFIWSTVTVKIK